MNGYSKILIGYDPFLVNYGTSTKLNDKMYQGLNNEVQFRLLFTSKPSGSFNCYFCHGLSVAKLHDFQEVILKKLQISSAIDRG